MRTLAARCFTLLHHSLFVLVVHNCANAAPWLQPNHPHQGQLDQNLVEAVIYQHDYVKTVFYLTLGANPNARSKISGDPVLFLLIQEIISTKERIKNNEKLEREYVDWDVKTLETLENILFELVFQFGADREIKFKTYALGSRDEEITIADYLAALGDYELIQYFNDKFLIPISSGNFLSKTTGNSLLHLVAKQGDDFAGGVIWLVSKYYLKVNRTNFEKKTPLMIAAENCSVRLVHLLLTFDANPSLIDAYGDSALDQALYKLKILTSLLSESPSSNADYSKHRVACQTVVNMLEQWKRYNQ